MNPQLFNQLVSWVETYGYIFIFIAMVIEGPFVTIAAAFAAAAGIFNVYIIFLLSVLSDIEGDVVYYIIGRWGRARFVEKYGKYIGLTSDRIKHFEKLLSENAWKTILIGKTTPFLPTIVLTTAGIFKMPVKKYAKIVMFVILPKTLLYVSIGYFAGRIHNLILDYFHYGAYALISAAIVIILIDYLIRKISSRFAKHIQKGV